MNKSKSLVVITLMLASGLFLSACTDNNSEDIDVNVINDSINSQEFSDNIATGEYELIDIRTDTEIAIDYIEGASTMDFYAPSFEADLEDLDKEVKYLIYCNSGNRSGSALDTMKGLGFVEVYDLDGGITEWRSLGFPVVTE